MVGTVNDWEDLKNDLADDGKSIWHFEETLVNEDEYGVPQIKPSQSVTRKQLGDFFEEEFYDIILPLVLGAKKGYEKDNWLKPDGIGASHKDNFGSIFRHVSEASVGMKLVHDADIDPRLCAACRLMMDYVRDKRGIKHIED